MRKECEVVRDILPLYADEVCSETSRELVEEHLQECAACREMLNQLRETEIESRLTYEKDNVIQYALKRFKRRSAAVGSLTSGLFMIPILLCLAVNVLRGPSLDWVSVVVAALLVVASLVIVPLLVPEDKLFWTFCAFCASLMLLLGVVCLYTRDNWFWVASSAVLFGLSLVFLPFLIRARPLQRLLGDGNRALVVLAVDGALFLNMLNMIRSQGRFSLNSLLYTVVVFVGIAVVLLEIYRHRKGAN